jgi:Rieske Fe-S protein
MIASDGILGRPNPWVDLFDPGRGPVRRGLWAYLKENADYPYYRVRDRFAGAEGKSLRAVERGQGKVVEYRGEKVAAFRDSNGALTVRSAVCTHMGCIVAWNDAERSWDCPCHGSRFTPGGDVIAGPAHDPLPEPESMARHPVGSEERTE